MIRRIPTLETERLLIRELTMNDLKDNDTSGGDASLAAQERWWQWTVLGYEMFAKLGQPHYGERGIVLKATGDLIGLIGIVPYIDSFGQIAAFKTRPGALATAEVGLFWRIDPPHRNQGYATEAARQLVYYLTRYERLHRIIATTGYSNLASQAVMRKIGMTVEHAARPQPPDIFVVGVLDNRSDWISRFHALISHPSRPAIWLRQWHTGWGLPRAQAPRYVWNGHTDQIVAALQNKLGGEVWVNRLIHHTKDERRKRIVGIFEVEVSGPPKHGEWVGGERLAGLALREEHLRPYLDATLEELATGAAPAQRPVWSLSGPGWRNKVRDWTGRELARLGHRVVTLEQVKHWCLSSVLRVKTDGPDFYFKVPARLPLFIDEAVATEKLAARFPHYVPAPVAIDRERGWMLFPDFGEPYSWHTRLTDREAVLRRMAGLQRESIGLVEELPADGIIDRRLDVLETQIDPLFHDPEALVDLTKEQIAELRRHAPRLKQLCRRLADLAIPQTLVHGDLHVGNAVRIDGEIMFFDWTDACISHPFFDLLSLRWEVDKFEKAAVRGAYLAEWADYESPAGLREADAIADVLRPLHHAVSMQYMRAGTEPLANAETSPPAGFLRDVLNHLKEYLRNSKFPEWATGVVAHNHE